jgi:hypothetical protein
MSLTWKKIHVKLREEDHDKLHEMFPERGALQHLVRRFLAELLRSNGDSVTISLKMRIGAKHAID